MRFLILAPSFPPILNPQALGTAKLARGLFEAGHEVTVVTRSAAHAGSARDVSSCWRRDVGTVLHVPPPRCSRRLASVLAKARWLDPRVSWFQRAALRASREILAERSFDWLVSRASADAVFCAHRLARELDLRWACFVSDPLPAHLYPEPYGRGRARNPLERHRERTTRRALSRADRVLFPCARLAAYMERALDLDLGERKLLVPHVGWASPQPQARPPQRELEILHTGGLGAERSCTVLLDCFADALERYPGLRSRLRLTFLGDRPEPLVRLVRSMRLEELVGFEPAVAFENALVRMARATALLLVEAPLAEGIFLPSKFADYAVSRKPLLLFSPEAGTIADKVSGFSHPGFLGQGRDGCVRGLDRFLGRLQRGGDLSDYTYGRPAEFEPQTVIGDLVERLCPAGQSVVARDMKSM
jgi:hypothetical protein